jgi:hypothetical protein
MHDHVSAYPRNTKHNSTCSFLVQDPKSSKAPLPILHVHTLAEELIVLTSRSKIVIDQAKRLQGCTRTFHPENERSLPFIITSASPKGCLSHQIPFSRASRLYLNPFTKNTPDNIRITQHCIPPSVFDMSQQLIQL